MGVGSTDGDSSCIPNSKRESEIRLFLRLQEGIALTENVLDPFIESPLVVFPYSPTLVPLFDSPIVVKNDQAAVIGHADGPLVLSVGRGLPPGRCVLVNLPVGGPFQRRQRW